MVEKILTPYLSQTLAVLSRTAGVASSQVRALGFLRDKLGERHRDRSASEGLKERPQTSARENTR